jgi:hypothetical protein
MAFVSDLFSWRFKVEVRISGSSNKAVRGFLGKAWAGFIRSIRIAFNNLEQ